MQNRVLGNGEMHVRYEEAVHYIEEIPKFTKKHIFDHTLEFIRRLGDPCHGKKILHVAGTNGKGSVCAFMQAILLCEGKRVGFFTSPHLERMNERIKIDGADISDEEFVRIFERVKQVVEEMEADGIDHPSYFEFLYGMGMLAFAEADVEYVILETGLGGRLDATNSFARPYLSVITSIGMDHVEILGDSIEKIAAEKAGIIKEGVPVFFDGSNEASSRIIEETAVKMHAPCRKIGKDAFEIQEITDKHIAFFISSEYDNNTVWQVESTGIYQMMNAALAVAAMQYVFGNAGNQEAWKKAVASVRWPGRMEEVLPGVVLDGAHNLAAIRQFGASIRAQKENGEEPQKTVILFSAVADKDYRGMIAELCNEVKADAYVITKLEDKRGAGAGTLADVFREFTEKQVLVEETLEDAFARAIEEKGSGGRLYCIGSLYLIGELKTLIGGRHA